MEAGFLIFSGSLENPWLIHLFLQSDYKGCHFGVHFYDVDIRTKCLFHPSHALQWVTVSEQHRQKVYYFSMHFSLLSLFIIHDALNVLFSSVCSWLVEQWVLQISRSIFLIVKSINECVLRSRKSSSHLALLTFIAMSTSASTEVVKIMHNVFLWVCNRKFPQSPELPHD